MRTSISCSLAFSVGLFTLLLVPSTVGADVYELRTYTTNEGKLDGLHARFRNHTVKLFEKHGMTNVGYWVPTDEPKSENTLIYVLRHKSREAAKASWKGFIADPKWRAVFKKSRTDGPLLAKGPESVFMKATDYSPKSSAGAKDDGGAVFELRIYKTHEDKLDNLNARFRDHTMKLFKRHAIQSVAYWVPTDAPASGNTLIYLIRHKNRDAAKVSWKAFGGDKEWRKVYAESTKDGRLLSERPKAVYMKGTDYSPIR